MKKKIISTVIIIGFAISVGSNLWFFGWKTWEAKIHNAYLRGVADVNEQEIYLRGANDVIAQIIAQAQQGKVIINANNRQLVLVPIQADPNK